MEITFVQISHYAVWAEYISPLTLSINEILYICSLNGAFRVQSRDNVDFFHCNIQGMCFGLPYSTTHCGDMQGGGGCYRQLTPPPLDTVLGSHLDHCLK